MIGLVKAALNKTIGNGFLRWKELEDVLLDVEVALNNRPLSYVEKDLQFPVLTGMMLACGKNSIQCTLILSVRRLGQCFG